MPKHPKNNFERACAYGERRLEDWFRPEVSARRQGAAIAIAAAATIWAATHYGHVPYRDEHLACFFVYELLGYTFTGSWLLPIPFLAVLSLGNELVVDLLKPNHPNIDVDQIACDHLGMFGAALLLVLLRRVWPGRPWKRNFS